MKQNERYKNTDKRWHRVLLSLGHRFYRTQTHGNHFLVMVVGPFSAVGPFSRRFGDCGYPGPYFGPD